MLLFDRGPTNFYLSYPDSIDNISNSFAVLISISILFFLYFLFHPFLSYFFITESTMISHAV